MKKILIAVIATVMTVFANNAQAMTQTDVVEYIHSTVEGASRVDARFCADAWQNGGQFIAEMTKGILICSKHRIEVGYYRPAK